MTAKEKEIRDWERKLMARIRRQKIKISKKLAVMTDDEIVEYYRKGTEELRARGINVI